MRLALISDFAFANLEMVIVNLINTNCSIHNARLDSHRNIFKRYNTARLLVSCILEIVQTVIVKDEPSSLPAFISSALLPEPAFLIGIEERVHQVVTIVLWYLERLGANTFVQRLQQFTWQVSPVIDAAIHRDKLLNRWLILHRRIMQ